MLRAHFKFISSQLLKGRAPGSAGENITSEYIQSQLRIAGVDPGNNGEYQQRVPLQSTTTTSTNAWSFSVSEHSSSSSDQTLNLLYYTDYVATTHINTILSLNKLYDSVVFVGFGIDGEIQDPSTGQLIHWNDYKSFNVSGKLVVILVGQPTQGIWANQPYSYYARWTYKFEEAQRKGASAALLVHTNATAGYPWSVVQHSNSGDQISGRRQVPGALDVASWIRSEATDALIKFLYQSNAYTLGDWFKIANQRDFSPLQFTNASSNIVLTFTRRMFTGTNTVGLIGGNNDDPEREAIVLTAHTDHFGVMDGEIFAGAVDNASGSAMLLTLASLFAQTIDHASLQRSIVFLWPTAEESGLLGSQYFVDNVPRSIASSLHHIRADLNFDIGNVWGLTKDLTVLGQDKSNLGDLFVQSALPEKLSITPDPSPNDGLYFRSDHFSFAKKDIPGVWVYVGDQFVDEPADFYNKTVQQGYFGDIYHSPKDVYHDYYQMDGMLQMICVTTRVALQLVSSLDFSPQCYVSCT